MFDNFFEKLGEIFSNDSGSGSGEYNGVSFDGGFEGIDLSQYSPAEIQESIRNAFETSDNSHGYEISFGASQSVDARNLAKSDLLDELSSHRIGVSRLSSDSLWGGLDSYSGDKVYNAINEARDNGRISASVYKELLSLLKKACHSQ